MLNIKLVNALNKISYSYPRGFSIDYLFEFRTNLPLLPDKFICEANDYILYHYNTSKTGGQTRGTCRAFKKSDWEELGPESEAVLW